MMDLTDEQVTALVNGHVAKLSEFFPCVQIMVSWDRGSNTGNLYRGAGNHFARMGMARDYLAQDVAQTTANEIAERMEEDQ